MPPDPTQQTLICDFPDANEVNAELVGRANLGRRAVRVAKPQYTGPGTLSPLSHAPINFAAAGDNVIIQGAPGLRLKVYALFLWNVTAQNLQLWNGASALNLTLTGPINAFPTASGILLPLASEPYFELDPGNSFIANLQNATQVSGFARYRSFAA